MKQPDVLITQMQHKDEKAFSKLYDMYSESIYGIINTIVNDPDLAEELLQDVFIKVWNKADNYDIKKGRFFTWILNIARNTAIDALRSKAYKNKQKNLDGVNFVDIMLGSDSLNQKTNAIGIQSFINKLKPNCVAIIDLLFFKGYTHNDAAKKLNIPIGTVKTRNRNCIKELRTIVLG